MKLKSFVLNQNQCLALWQIVRFTKLRYSMMIVQRAVWRNSNDAESKAMHEIKVEWITLWDTLLPIEVTVGKACVEFATSKTATISLPEPSFVALEALLTPIEFNASMEGTEVNATPQSEQVVKNLREIYHPQLVEIVKNAGVVDLDPELKKARASGRLTTYVN